MRVAALTGATGFLGRHLVRALEADGWRVRALVRRDPPRWDGASPEMVRGDLADSEALRRLCAGAEAVIHVAGLIKARRASDFDAVNVGGAAALARAARAAAPDAAFLLVSSIAAREPQLSAYAASKRSGERAVADVLGSAVTVLRPPLIYGPGDRESLALFKAAASLPALPVFNPQGRLAAVHVTDAAAQIASLAGGRLAGRTIALSDARPEGYAWREVMRAAAEAVGCRPLLLPTPDVLVRAAGLVGDLAAMFGAGGIMGAGKAREGLHRDWSVHAVERDADARPPRFTLAAGFADTVAWARAAGHLPRRA